jgi:hypothetical protein
VTPSDWNETAKGLAGFVHSFRVLVERGAVPLKFRDDPESAREETASPLVVGVFGNDNQFGDLAEQEVDLIRSDVQDADLEELAFALSEDGASWAMLIGAAKDRYRTAAARAFQRELLQIFLEDVVWRAWRQVQPRD